VTVSVTPVGKVVILGVGVPIFDSVTERETLVVAHRDAGGVRVDETEFVLRPEVVSVFDIRAVVVCLTLDETVVEDDCDLLVLAEGVYVPEELVVLELLLLPVRVAEATELLDNLGLVVADGVAVSAGELVGLRVSLELGPVVTDSEGKGDAVLLPATDALSVLVACSVDEPLLVLEGDAETLDVFVCVTEPVVVTDTMGVRVSRMDAVLQVEAVGVFEEETDLVNVGDAEPVLVAWTLRVAVLVARVEPLPVTLLLDVLELETLREAVGEAVDVFDADTDCVPVTETMAVFDALVVFVKDGEAEEVLDEARVLVWVTLAVLVLEGGADLVEHGLLEAVFELETELLLVFVGCVERVEVVEAVTVLETRAVPVPQAEEDAVLETVVLRVVVCVAVTVFVEVVLSVPGSVGLVDFVAAVVRVDVLEGLELRDGNALSPMRCLRFTVIFRGSGGVVAIPPISQNKMNHFIFLPGYRMFSLCGV